MIPNLLWQTWKSNKIPFNLKDQMVSWGKSNPHLKRTVMSDQECSDFILEHFGKDVHFLYSSLPQPIMRADFWRVAVVYVFGGYYSDLDITCNIDFNEVLDPVVKAIFTEEFNNISNFFFAATPKHPVLRLCLDYMIDEAKNIIGKDVQSFGMHSLHRSVIEYYGIINSNYESNSEVYFLDSEMSRERREFIHSAISMREDIGDYQSWRRSTLFMKKEREESSNITFFTTFNKNGYDLYGKKWIETFIITANYFNKFKAVIYHEGFAPPLEHPNITWIKYEDAIPQHDVWKKEYLKTSNHHGYVKMMTLKFSHKGFVIQHALDNIKDDYIIWLDGDCIFKNCSYGDFPKNIIQSKFLACQVEHAQDLNHIESGILIFDGKHPDKKKFNREFKKWYRITNILPMSQPYDGFIIFKALLTSKLNYVDLNLGYGRDGIQSDPDMTFCNPEIKDRFLHNIGWTGKNQYEDWKLIYSRDDVYRRMESMLFGREESMRAKRAKIMEKIEKFKKYRK